MHAAKTHGKIRCRRRAGVVLGDSQSPATTLAREMGEPTT